MGLSVRDAVKSFAGDPVIRGASLHLRPGQVLGLLGPNGAGKTTLLRALLGLLALDSGEVLVDGTPYRGLDRPLAHVGTAIGSATVDPRLSGKDNLCVYAAATGAPPERAALMLQLVGLDRWAARRVSAYSLGMKKRLSIAVALLPDPRYLVLDEPANGLDPDGLRWLKRLLAHLSRDLGKGILVSSHMLADLESLLDAVAILADGEVRFAGSMDELRGPGSTYVQAAGVPALARALAAAGLPAVPSGDGLCVAGDERAAVGRAALDAGIPLLGLEVRRKGLEEAYFGVVGESVRPTRGAEGRAT